VAFSGSFMSSIPGYQIISSAFNTLCSFEKHQNLNVPT